MKGNALVLLIIADVVQLLKSGGYIDANNDFGDFSDLAKDLQLVTGIEKILENYGANVPAKIDAIIALIPSLVALFK